MNQYSYIDFKFEQGNGQLCEGLLCRTSPFPLLEGTLRDSCLGSVLKISPGSDPVVDCLDSTSVF